HTHSSSFAPQHNTHAYPTRRSSDLNQIVGHLRIGHATDIEIDDPGIAGANAEADAENIRHVQRGAELDRLAGEIRRGQHRVVVQDRKSTRLNSSHVKISYAVFCLKK